MTDMILGSPFYKNGLTWISKYIQYNVWDEITYPFSNFNGCTVEVWEWIRFVILHFTGYVVIIHAEIKVNPYKWKGPRSFTSLIQILVNILVEVDNCYGIQT